MYKRVQTPNSPLMPLSPMGANMGTNVMTKTPTNFLSPSFSLPRNRIRRSFTPCNANGVLSPPSVSPIVKRKYATPQNSPTNKLVRRSANTSIKILRSSVRQEGIQMRKRSLNSLSPLRRTLFPVAHDPPKIVVDTSNLGAQTPSNKLKRLLEPPSMQRANRSFEEYHTPIGHVLQEMEHDIEPSTPNILDRTFTVRSILKELHLEKYIDLFNMHEIDLFVLSQITAEDLAELGIDECDRDILLEAIEEFGIDEHDKYKVSFNM